MLRLIFSLAVMLYIQQSINCQSLSESTRSLNANNAGFPVIVELAIFCDKQCAAGFQNNRQKLIDYWAVYIQDINIKFKTLPSLDISFRVTSLNLITKETDQPFIEAARRPNGDVVMGSALSKFGAWLYDQETKYPDFDIAVLVTGANSWYQILKYVTFGVSACHKNHSTSLHKSTIILNYQSTLGFACYSLDRALARVLGQEYTDDDCSSTTKSTSTPTCNMKLHFFQKCHDHAISRYLNSPEAACLHTRNDSVKDALENATVAQPPSFDEQCQMITGNENATVNADHWGYVCIFRECYIPAGMSLRFASDLISAEGTPCGPNKICFRGRCLAQGYQLQNIQNGKCLKSRNRFSATDYPVMMTCSSRPTPLDQFMFLGDGLAPDSLATPYSIEYTTNYGDKCLSVSNLDKIQYENCSEHNLYQKWDFVNTGVGDIFFLRNRFTNSCIVATEDNNVRLDDFCDVNESKLYWKITGRDPVPSYWLKNLEETAQFSGPTKAPSSINFSTSFKPEDEVIHKEATVKTHFQNDVSLLVTAAGIFGMGFVFSGLIALFVVRRK